MLSATATARPRRLTPIFAWQRLLFALCASLPFGLLLSIASTTPALVWVSRAMLVGLMAMLIFGLFEQ